MAKYDVWFCSCGRIHLMNNDKYDWLADDFENRTIIRVCQNCGLTRKTWLDEESYFDGELDKPSFIICGTDLKEKEFIGDGNTQFIFSSGIPVPLESGAMATYCGRAGDWFDDAGKCKVWTERLINNVKHQYKDDAKDVLDSISGYVSGIDWSGTPYSHEAKEARSKN